MATLWSVFCDAMASDRDQVLMREAIRLMRDAGVVKKTGRSFRRSDRQGRTGGCCGWQQRCEGS